MEDRSAVEPSRRSFLKLGVLYSALIGAVASGGAQFARWVPEFSGVSDMDADRLDGRDAEDFNQNRLVVSEDGSAVSWYMDSDDTDLQWRVRTGASIASSDILDVRTESGGTSVVSSWSSSSIVLEADQSGNKLVAEPKTAYESDVDQFEIEYTK
jgi:hypothetical protein